MLSKITLVLGLVAATLLAVGGPAQAVTGEITGTVTAYSSPRPNVPVKAYSVVADASEGQVLEDSTVTDAQGHYTLQTDLSEVIVCFESPDYVRECWQDVPQSQGDEASYGTPVHPQVAGGASGINASLIGGGFVQGDLGLNNDIDPVIGGAVTLTSDSAFFHTAADTDGSYGFDHVPPGSYRLCARGTNLLQVCLEDFAVADGSFRNDGYFFFDPVPQTFAATAGGDDWAQWSWAPIAGATQYRIAISGSPTMSNAKVRYVDSRFATFRDLTRGKTYYASVRALNLTQSTVPTRAFPAKPGTVVGLRRWQTTYDTLEMRSGTYPKAPRYQFRLSSSRTFAGARVRTDIETVVFFGRLTHGATYYVQVRAVGSTGNPLTAWSPTVAARVGVE